LGVRLQRRAPGIVVVWVNEIDGERELGEGELELRDGAAVDRARGDDVVARLAEREENRRLRRHAAGERHRADAPFEAGDALLEGRHRRVHDAAVDIAVFLQVEVSRRRGGVLEGERRGLIQRHGGGAGIGVRPVPGMYRARLETERMRLLPVGGLGVGIGHSKLLTILGNVYPTIETIGNTGAMSKWSSACASRNAASAVAGSSAREKMKP